MKKKRLDILLVEKGLSENRSHAQRIIMAGDVMVEGQLAEKPSQLFEETSCIQVKVQPRYVSRGGEKLEFGLRKFGIENMNGYVCVDVGASTGGFSDCLLQHGAMKVYTIDVGYGQLHYSLRNDPRIVVMERTNVRDIASLPEPISLVTVDASFISLKMILPIIKKWPFKNEFKTIALVKPQFEVGREIAAKGKGVISDEKIRQKVVNDVIEFSKLQGYLYIDMVQSPLKGPKGNVEFLIFLNYPNILPKR